MDGFRTAFRERDDAAEAGMTSTGFGSASQDVMVIVRYRTEWPIVEARRRLRRV